MAQQNIYDNEIFFSGYKKIRDKKVNANNLFEIPALFSMMQIHYAHVIRAATDGREIKMVINYI